LLALLALIPAGAAAQELPADIEEAFLELDERCVLISLHQEPPVIVIGPAETEPERFAAEELARHLEWITGQKIAITDDADVPVGTKTIAHRLHQAAHQRLVRRVPEHELAKTRQQRIVRGSEDLDLVGERGGIGGFVCSGAIGRH